MKNSILILSAVLMSGCVYTKVTTKNQATMTRISVFGNQNVGNVNLDTGTLNGYASEQAQATEAIVSGAVSGALKARP